MDVAAVSYIYVSAMEDRRRAELADLAKVLLLVQAAILTTSTIESGLFAIAFSGGMTGIVVLTAASAVALFVALGRIERSPRARRVVVAIEVLLVVSFGIDSALSLILTAAPLPLMTMLAGFVTPVAITATLLRIGRSAALSVEMA